jgi:predicted nucleotidyltransferase component of viral defense system
MNYHAQVLGTVQHRVLRQLGAVMTRQGFYLSGGTALALHLGHRKSVDLDWFSPNPLADPLRLAEELQAEGIVFRTGQFEPGTLHGTVARVRISLLEYRYPLLKPLATCHPFRCQLASRADLAAMKLAALAQRGAKKDFVDVYALIATGTPLLQLLASYKLKYSVRDVAHLLYSLCYFEDADKERMPRMVWDIDWKTIKSQVRQRLQDLAR